MGRDCPADYGVRYSIWHVAQKTCKDKTQSSTSIVFDVLYLSWNHLQRFASIACVPSYIPCRVPGKEGDGRLIEMYGFGVAVVNDKLQLTDVDIYYKTEPFFQDCEKTSSSVLGSVFLHILLSLSILLTSFFVVRRVRGLIETPGFAWNRWHRCVGRRWARDGVFYEVTS